MIISTTARSVFPVANNRLDGILASRIWNKDPFALLGLNPHPTTRGMKLFDCSVDPRLRVKQPILKLYIMRGGVGNRRTTLQSKIPSLAMQTERIYYLDLKFRTLKAPSK